MDHFRVTSGPVGAIGRSIRTCEKSGHKIPADPRIGPIFKSGVSVRCGHPFHPNPNFLEMLVDRRSSMGISLDC